MIKNRSFLLGLGTGIAAGALILQLALIGQGQAGGDQTLDLSTLTREQVQEAADELELKVYDASAEVMTEEEWTEAKAEERAQGSSTSSSDNSGKNPSSDGPVASTPEQPDQPAAPENSQAPKPADEPAPGTISYRVINGATLNDVADHLSSLRVLDNRDAFIEEARKQKINNKIQVGSYEFTEGESIDSVISKLISGP
ncbi:MULTISPECIES: hypothetical protein [unclassified Paenibacillus]|uniref:hypothetical protein n=1 Tax=unclassified Paenibacillus TaxID=185978 RepID=UPI000895D330|nr:MULTISPECIES: hypothetical protein [unclassified Paenibacillus]OMC70983.1 hypothetical protein BK126_02415 [Paenibacillus sp. FSL H7-0326]SDW15602.1 hypothetical protein SAMN05518848_101436 [Paenibacillus sp. PDC88]